MLVQEAFAIVLLQIDERRTMVARLRQQVERVDRLVPKIDLADIPRHAFLHHPFAAAEPVPYFQRAFGEADRTRAMRQPVVFIENNDGNAVLREIDRGRETDGTRTDNDDRMMHGLARVLIWRAHVRQLEFLIIRRHRGTGFVPETRFDKSIYRCAAPLAMNFQRRATSSLSFLHSCSASSAA